jgi:tetratricopeptide (TPR) repeat protein
MTTNRPGHPWVPGSGAGGNDDVLQRAMTALGGNRPNEAEQIARDILNADRRNARASYVLGSALVMQGRPQDAIAPLEDAARGRHDAQSDTMLAIALRQTGRVEDAYSRLKRTTKRQPPYAAAFLEFGRVLASMERDAEAVEALVRGVEVAPMMPEMSIQLGYVLLRRRRFADAKSAFARALTIVPDSPDALFGIAQALQENGESQAAADYFRRYLIVSPGDQTAWVRLGLCLLALGQRDAGHDCFRTVARRDAKGFGNALSSLVKSSRGRFWLKPSDAARFLRGINN